MQQVINLLDIVAGGYYPYNTAIERIDYSNDTAVISALSASPSYNAMGAGNASYGYIAGGIMMATTIQQ